MCRALGVNRTSFHDWQRRAPSDRELTDAWLTEKIKQIHADSDGTYGARRVHAELRLEHGIRVGRKRVERLMKAAGISGLLPRKRRRTTVRLPGVRVAPDLVERDFRPDGPNQTWSADITYISTWEGFVYLAHVQDLFSRLIVGWSMADHLRSELVVSALEMALARRRPSGPPLGASLRDDSRVTPNQPSHHHQHHSESVTRERYSHVNRHCCEDRLSLGNSPRCCSPNAAPRPGSRSRWARSAIAMTTPSARPSTPASKRRDLPAILADPSRGAHRGLWVHRGLVQPATPALNARLPVPDRVRAKLHRACSTGARGPDFA